MRLNKKSQYGLLFAIYVSRAGRATLEGAAEGLNLSKNFLDQIARTLRMTGVLKSIRGPKGGYELNGDPSVYDVLTSLGAVTLLDASEVCVYAAGSAEERAFLHYVQTLGLAMRPWLKMKVKTLSVDSALSEVKKLNQVSAQVN